MTSQIETSLDLRSVVRQCADKFRFYEQSHRAKGTPDADAKAEVNRQMVAICEASLSRADRKVHWRCFHCGDTFTKAQERWAREHFGRNEGEQPVCLIRTAGEGALLRALRNAQDELAEYRSEDGDLVRALLSMQADHATALRDTEERGYAKGLADGRAEASATEGAAR